MSPPPRDGSGLRRLGELTTDEVRALLARPPTAVLVPVGSVEPHGPHLPLATDTVLSETAAARACEALAACGVEARVAPSVPYGVTEFADGFAGAVSVPGEVLTALLRAIATRLLADGWSHVCFVNNHLEPAHDAAVRAAAEGLRVSVASPLTRRWARTLSDEFKRGDCHAGRYETSLVLAAGGRVLDAHHELPPVGVSLAEAIRAGKNRFRDIGMDRAYTGAPGEATREEGEQLYERLVEMIVTEVVEGLAGAPGPNAGPQPRGR
jgi:creatinine amidohydrolase